MFQFQKISFLLITIKISFVLCLENYQNDSVVYFNDNIKHSGTNISSGEGYERTTADFYKNLTSQGFWTFLSLTGNSECKSHVNIIHQESANWSLWAIKLLDASAKLPSGILSGNLNQYGDFDECLSSEGHFSNQIIRGKYCLANIEIKISANERNEKIKVLDALIHSHRMLKNELKDQGHRIPRVETFNWGICTPASCSSNEIKTAFNKYLYQVSNGSPFHLEASFSDEVCYVKHKNEPSTFSIGVKVMFLTIVILLIVGTLTDKKIISIRHSKLVKILQCFSLNRNCHLLLKTDMSKDDLKCLHGARFLNAIALLLSHKQIAMLFNPIPNRTEVSEALGKFWTMIGRSAILYTDSFLIFSGLLASYTFVKELDKKKNFNFKNKLINRFVRFTPNLFCIIFFCTFIMDSLGSGPQWGLVVTKYTNLCKKHMWRNFLYIHNYFGFENMCLTHTHQLGIDMQLFLVSPIFIYAIWRFPKLGSLVIIVVSTASSWLRYNVTYRENLSTLLYYGISVDRLWRTANLSYILPTHRLTVYLIGIFLGYYLRRGGKNLYLTSWQATIGWILAIFAGFLAVFGPYTSAFKEYVYDAREAARFNAFAPILWAAFISWVIVACVNGYGGVFNDFLSWKYFIIFTRISYAVYLTQFPVFFYNVGSERFFQYYKGFHSLFDLFEYGMILIASIVMTLAFDIPFQELKKTIYGPFTPNREVLNENDEALEPRHLEEREYRGSKKRKRLQSFGT